MLQRAEHAFLVFLEDAEAAFEVITQDAARRRALRDQPQPHHSSPEHSSPAVDQTQQSPAMTLTAAHLQFISRLAEVLSRLPGSNAGRPLAAIAASIGAHV